MSAWIQYALCASITVHALFSAVLFAPWPNKDKGWFGQVFIEAREQLESHHEASFRMRLRSAWTQDAVFIRPFTPHAFVPWPFQPTCPLRRLE